MFDTSFAGKIDSLIVDRNFEGGSAAWEQVGPGKDLKPDTFRLP